MLELAPVTITLAPVALNVPDPVPLAPATTLPRDRVAGETVSWPVPATPVPDKDMVSVGLLAFEVSVTLPLAALAEAGAKVTLKVALCPADRVTGAVMPLRLKPVPLIDACEMVTLVPPVFVTVSDKD